MQFLQHLYNNYYIRYVNYEKGQWQLEYKTRKKVQNGAARIDTNSPYDTPSQSLMEKLRGDF